MINIAEAGVISRHPQSHALDTRSVLVSLLRPENLLAAGPSTVDYSCPEDGVVISSFDMHATVMPALDLAVDTAEDANEDTRSASAGQHRDLAGIEDGQRKGLGRWKRAREGVR